MQFSNRPFVGYRLGWENWYLHGFFAIDVPTQTSDVTIFYTDVGVGYFLLRTNQNQLQQLNQLRVDKLALLDYIKNLETIYNLPNEKDSRKADTEILRQRRKDHKRISAYQTPVEFGSA